MAARLLSAWPEVDFNSPKTPIQTKLGRDSLSTVSWEDRQKTGDSQIFWQFAGYYPTSVPKSTDCIFGAARFGHDKSRLSLAILDPTHSEGGDLGAFGARGSYQKIS